MRFELLGREWGACKNEGMSRVDFYACCMWLHTCVCALAALRPDELEQFKADEALFRSWRYGTRPGVDECESSALFSKPRMSDDLCLCSQCIRTCNFGARCKPSFRGSSRRTWKRSLRRGQTLLERCIPSYTSNYRQHRYWRLNGLAAS